MTGTTLIAGKEEADRMKTKVLVAYASKYGSTQEVAEAVAATLQDHGFEVDIQPVGKVRRGEGYGAVVLGTAIYYGAWRKEAHGFLERNRGELEGRPVALFAMGPIGDSLSEKDRSGFQATLQKELAKHPWLTPVALEIFGGKFDPARLDVADRLVTSLPASPLHGKQANDLRNWAAIRAWAGSLAATLQPVSI